MIARWIAAVGAAFALHAAEPALLEPGIPEEVYVAPGRATTVLFRTDRKVSAISLASPIVTYKYDKGLNQLELTPAVRSGGVETNLNLRIGAEVYVLLIRVVEDIRAEWVRTFSLPDERPGGDEADLSAAQVLSPQALDLVAAAQTMERAERDGIFRAAHPALRLRTLASTQSWNDCRVDLDLLAQFLDLDLLLFRVRWVNRTADALYLHPTQYALWASGHEIPVVARYSPDEAVILPGAACHVYLAVQGLRLSRDNAWQLRLPPEASRLGL